ncbi:MAG TPA: GNAT family N-acetyltransferase, partial [Dongiaceae bacterium]
MSDPSMSDPSIEIRPGCAEDFTDIESVVEAATRDAFHHPDLTPEQVAENAWIVSIAQRTCRAALDHPVRRIFVAIDAGRTSSLAGFVIIDAKDAALPEIDWLIVAPEFRGRKLPGGNVAQRLMQAALDWIGSDRPAQLGVIHYNARAIAFYRKFGFAEAGRRKDKLKIPRTLMIRPAAVCGVRPAFPDGFAGARLLPGEERNQWPNP